VAWLDLGLWKLMVDVDGTRMLVWATIMEVGGDTMMAYR